MTDRGDSIRVLRPLFQGGEGGSSPTSPLQLVFSLCPKDYARVLNRAWHSRLPECQRGPWTEAFHAEFEGVTYAVALWNSPSARCLPQHWRELRRLACAPDAPRFTPSRFLSWMVRWYRKNHPEVEHLISYQDTAVHLGTIYRASGWTAEYESRPRVRDRSKPRVGTDRAYRSNLNGPETDASGKVRWGIDL